MDGPASRRELHITMAIIVVLLGCAVCFRLMYLSSIPGINGDEGWWGVQATRWGAGVAYEAKTTSGNPVDKLFLVPLGVLHKVAPPSFFVLRALPAFSNLLALILGFLLVRRIFGSTTAWIQTVTLAIAPTAIAHSRFCQDPSQSILFTSIVIYLCLLALKERKRTWIYFGAAVVMFPLALWTHPTNIFIAPFLLLPLWPTVKRWTPDSRRGRWYFVAAAAGVATVLGLLLLFVVWPALKGSTGTSSLLDKPWLATAGKRFIDPGQWFEYVRNYGRLFTGVTIYRYFSGPHLTVIAYSISFLVVAAGIVWGMRLVIKREKSVLDYGLVFGWAAMWLLFFAFAGPESIRPHVERWGLCLIVPATLIAARGLTGWIGAGTKSRRWSIAVATVVAACLLGSFYLNYFREFQTSGGRSHRTFVTADVEPKQQALEQILSRAGDRPVRIFAQEWWAFWPIVYLAQPDPKVTVTMSLPTELVGADPVYLVEFVGTPEHVRALEWIRQRGATSTATTIKDSSGRDALVILSVTAH